MKNRIFEANLILDDMLTAIHNIGFNDSFSDVVELLINCKGKVITTGMGKAGMAMRKFTSTLCSLGFPSVFMHPGEAQHGDMGMVRDEDLLFVASTSGKTREVLELMDLVRNVGKSKIIGITSHFDSPIRSKVDKVVDMGSITEAGHLNLAPTTSILVMLAITDCLALVAAKEKGLSKAEYGKYHHAGYLGIIARENQA